MSLVEKVEEVLNVLENMEEQLSTSSSPNTPVLLARVNAFKQIFQNEHSEAVELEGRRGAMKQELFSVFNQTLLLIQAFYNDIYNEMSQMVAQMDEVFKAVERLEAKASIKHGNNPEMLANVKQMKQDCELLHVEAVKTLYQCSSLNRKIEDMITHARDVDKSMDVEN